jgi:putative ABC transport system ATP-binding protein
MPESLIRLDAVTKVFVTDEVETHALAGIHLDIQKGEYISIAGPSGCGKSTLLAILGLLDSPSDGTYTLNSHPVQGLKLSERARIRNREIGFIFQAFNLIGDLTVYENVELPLTYRGMPSSERKKRVHDALERVGMGHRVKHYPSQLSGGQQQRVAVARALGGDPSILLADEPTGNLDSANGEQVMDLLRELHRAGSTICIVTHDPRYARYADRSIHLFDGRVVEETPHLLKPLPVLKIDPEQTIRIPNRNCRPVPIEVPLKAHDLLRRVVQVRNVGERDFLGDLLLKGKHGLRRCAETRHGGVYLHPARPEESL